MVYLRKPLADLGGGARGLPRRRRPQELPLRERRAHLWAHIQEGALASSSTVLDDPELLEVAIRSADALVVPSVARAFAGPARPRTT